MTCERSIPDFLSSCSSAYSWANNIKTLVPRLKELKRRHLGNPKAILHSRDIRRLEGPFSGLRQSEQKKQAFYQDLDRFVTEARVRLFAVVVDKRRLKDRFLFSVNPYDVSLSQLMSLACGPPGTPAVNRPNVAKVIAESRGKLEDKELQAEYQRFREAGYGVTALPTCRIGSRRR